MSFCLQNHPHERGSRELVSYSHLLKGNGQWAMSKTSQIYRYYNLGSLVEINYIALLTNIIETILSFLMIIKFNHVVHWSM